MGSCQRQRKKKNQASAVQDGLAVFGFPCRRRLRAGRSSRYHIYRNGVLKKKTAGCSGGGGQPVDILKVHASLRAVVVDRLSGEGPATALARIGS